MIRYRDSSLICLIIYFIAWIWTFSSGFVMDIHYFSCFSFDADVQLDIYPVLNIVKRLRNSVNEFFCGGGAEMTITYC